ncbi:MAG: hypothetical protein IK003_02495 [Prevotella sp.]|nr:hypothetical protein [Prevotella sp.]
MKKIRKEDFAILNESEMKATKGGIMDKKPIGICGHMEFACCYYNYKVDLPTLPYEKEF